MIQSRVMLLAVAFVAGGAATTGCHRIADEVSEQEDFRVGACEQVCETIDGCDPGRFLGEEPDGCFDRCMTLIPKLHQENQCGSRKILEYRCVGELTCDEFTAYEDALPVAPGMATSAVPCTPEAEAAAYCSEQAPFDLDETPG
jgi:hypothetical protein